MSKGLQIFIEYPIRKNAIKQYEETMKNVLCLLPEFGAVHIQWYLSTIKSNHYVETFYVPTESHFFALKRLRKEKQHNVFGVFEQFVEGGMNEIQYLALKKSS